MSIDLKKNTDKKIENENKRTINYQNIKKLVLFIVVGVLSISIIFSFFSFGDSEKTYEEDINFSKEKVQNEDLTFNSSYSNQNRDNTKIIEKESEHEIDEYREEYRPDSTQQEIDPIEQFLKEQELEKVRRYYQAKLTPFKSTSERMNTAYKTTDTSVVNENGNSYSPFDNNYIYNGLDVGNVNPNMQKEKARWIKEAALRNFVRKDYLTPSISKYEVKAGTFIPIISTFELISDVQGKVTAMVNQDVYDTVTGNYLLIPMGTKLFGQYNSEISWGQERVQVVFNRMTLPNGKSINLGTMLGGSELGQSGMTGKVDAQLGKVVGSIIMAAAVGGAEGALTNNGSYDKDRNATLSKSGESAGEQTLTVVNNYADKILNVQPRITVPFGKRGTLIISEDLILEPYNKKPVYFNK